MKGARESKRAKKKKAFEEHWEDSTIQKERRDRARWLARPRIHTGIFDDLANDEELAAAKIVAPPSASERARELDDLMNTLRLSGKRRALFKQVNIAYRRERTIESYIQIRRNFPEVEIQIGRYRQVHALYALEEDFK